MKEFWKCSEFYTAVVPAVFGILIVSGVISADKAAALQQNILTIVGALLTIVPSVAYANNRTALKRSVTEVVGYAAEGQTTQVGIQSVGSSTLGRLREAGI